MTKTTFQKILVISGLSSIALSNGLIFGQTTGMINALKKNDDGISLSEGNFLFIGEDLQKYPEVYLVCLFPQYTEATETSSGVTLMTSCGFALATVSDKIGRRWPFVISSIAVIIHWIIIYHARSMLYFVLSRVIAGSAFGARFSLNILTTSEYTSPKTRAFFLNIITTVAPAIGTGLGHFLGTIFHWRTVALIAIFPSVFGVILPYFWVESPHWLASKGRFQECEQSFRKIHGNSTKSESELLLLIKMEKNKLKRAEQTNLKTVRKKLYNAIKKKYFWNLILLSFFMHAYLAASGKVAFTILATIMLEEMTDSQNVLLYTMIIDSFVLIGGCMSCVLIKKMTMRNVLFSTGYSANSILVILGACLYFNDGSTYLRWINVILLAFYFIIIESGPCPVLEALMGEIYPLEIKVYCFFLSGTMLTTFMTLSITLFPVLSNVIGYYGIFLLNSVIMSICLLFIWLRLPETKGRTLQEIEFYFKTKILDVDDVLSDEHVNMLF